MGGPRTFNIELQILTEIFTGGPERKSEVIRDTGLIGSLRWWYEALIRGVGGTACDPSQGPPCEERLHCDACELFGCSVGPESSYSDPVKNQIRPSKYRSLNLEEWKMWS